mmetsp:Transcript_3667/g.3798  ORF Transcript_3667/g.3798 Transcript_3667/m.3798 type:complete len:363 (-) Transcript_3667:138-1226(-)
MMLNLNCFADPEETTRNLLGGSSSRGDINATTSGSDSRLINYHNTLSQSLVTEIHLEHIFLDLREEVKLEQHAIFSRPHNVKTISLLLSHFELERPGENVVVVSMNSYTTVVYHRTGVLGCFYVGSLHVIDNPSLVLQLIRQVMAAARSQGLHVPVIFCNTIGKYINQSINLFRETTESCEKMISTESLDLALKSRDSARVTAEEKKFAAVWMLLTLMMQEAIATDAQIIVKSNKKPCLEHEWITEKAKVTSQNLSNGVYMIDFASEMFTIYYYHPSSSELVILSRDSSFIVGEYSIVALMKNEKMMTTVAFSRFMSHIREKITIHALTNCVHPIVCQIVQTGPMRQQHYIGDSLPHVDLIL